MLSTTTPNNVVIATSNDAASGLHMLDKGYIYYQRREYVGAVAELSSGIHRLVAALNVANAGKFELRVKNMQQQDVERKLQESIALLGYLQKMYEEGQVSLAGMFGSGSEPNGNQSAPAGGGQSKSSSAGGKGGDDEDDMQCLEPVRYTKGCKFFNDLIGMKQEKQDLEAAVIKPMLYPTLFSAARGILFYGPPGTGKTQLVRALSNEVQFRLAQIRSGESTQTGGILFYTAAGSDMKSKFVGGTERKIEALFNCAQKRAEQENAMAVLFIDEVENVVGDRKADESGQMTNSVNSFLRMMDGFNRADRVIVIAATNYPWRLDGAFLRRIDTRILVDLPSQQEISEIMIMELEDYVLSMFIAPTTKSIQDPDMGENARSGLSAAGENVDRKAELVCAKSDRTEGANDERWLFQEPFITFLARKLGPRNTKKPGPTFADESSVNKLKAWFEYLSQEFAKEFYSHSDTSSFMRILQREMASTALENGSFTLVFIQQLSANKSKLTEPPVLVPVFIDHQSFESLKESYTDATAEIDTKTNLEFDVSDSPFQYAAHFDALNDQAKEEVRKLLMDKSANLEELYKIASENSNFNQGTQEIGTEWAIGDDVGETIETWVTDKVEFTNQKKDKLKLDEQKKTFGYCFRKDIITGRVYCDFDEESVFEQDREAVKNYINENLNTDATFLSISFEEKDKLVLTQLNESDNDTSRVEFNNIADSAADYKLKNFMSTLGLITQSPKISSSATITDITIDPTQEKFYYGDDGTKIDSISSFYLEFKFVESDLSTLQSASAVSNSNSHLDRIENFISNFKAIYAGVGEIPCFFSLPMNTGSQSVCLFQIVEDDKDDFELIRIIFKSFYEPVESSFLGFNKKYKYLNIITTSNGKKIKLFNNATEEVEVYRSASFGYPSATEVYSVQLFEEKGDRAIFTTKQEEFPFKTILEQIKDMIDDDSTVTDVMKWTTWLVLFITCYQSYEANRKVILPYIDDYDISDFHQFISGGTLYDAEEGELSLIGWAYKYLTEDIVDPMNQNIVSMFPDQHSLSSTLKANQGILQDFIENLYENIEEETEPDVDTFVEIKATEWFTTMKSIFPKRILSFNNKNNTSRFVTTHLRALSLSADTIIKAQDKAKSSFVLDDYALMAHKQKRDYEKRDTNRERLFLRLKNESKTHNQDTFTYNNDNYKTVLDEYLTEKNLKS